MHMHIDDEVYAVDDVFLGPRGQQLPFRVRYRAYGIGFVLYLLIIAIEAWVGLLAPWPAIYGLVFTIWTTMQIMQHVDHDRTAKSVFITFWHEVGAPRTRRLQKTTARMSLTSVRRTR